jgi:hypothetical protein
MAAKVVLLDTNAIKTIQSGMIQTGGVVKDAPDTNPIDLILAVDSIPTTDGQPQVYTPIQTNIAEVPGPDVLPNAAVVAPAAATKNLNGLLIAAAGLGALLLFSKDGKKAVQGITGIGKKKKDNMLPLLIVGGAAAYWYFTQTPAAAAAPPAGLPLTPPVDPASGIPAPAVYGVVITDPKILLQPLPNDTTVYNLLYAYSTPWRYAVDRMTAPERQALYVYVWGYIKPGLHLYNYVGTYPDGFYDPALYAEVLALSTKWNLGLLY